MLAWLLLAAATPSSTPPTPDRIRASIEQHRKGEVVVRVTDGGQPVSGARVEIRQRRHAFLFGANIFNLDPQDTSPSQKAYQERFAALFNYATLPFYWSLYEPERGRPAEARLRAMAEWCRAHGIATKGHPVLWHQTFPSWVRADEPMEPLLAKRIAGTVGAFKGLVARWDVVNESLAALQDQPKNPWSLLIGSTSPTEAVLRALQSARQANPDALLLVNDFEVGPAYQAQIAELLKRGAPMQAVGVQSHMHGGEWPPEKTWGVCQAFGRLALPLHFTEVTVLSGPKRTPMTDYHTKRTGWNTTPEDEAKQADYVERFYELVFACPAAEAITWWDLSDDRAWMRAPAGLLRQDMSPKPAYERLARRIKGEWWTAKAEARTGTDGRAALRGFLGDYDATVTFPDGSSRTLPLAIRRGTAEPVSVAR